MLLVIIALAFPADIIVHYTSNSQLNELTEKYNKLQCDYAVSELYSNQADSAIMSILNYSNYNCNIDTQRFLARIFCYSRFTYHIFECDRIKQNNNNNKSDN